MSMPRFPLRALVCLLIAFALLKGSPAWALVDMNNGSYANVFLDMPRTDTKRPGDPESEWDGNNLLRLSLSRAYKSRTLFNGLFGFGWCSDLETRLRFSAGGIVTHQVCGDSLETPYLDNGNRSGRPSLADTVLARQRQAPQTARLAEILGLEAPAWERARAALLEDDELLDRLGQQQGMNFRPAAGTVLRENGTGRTVLRVEADRIVRHDPDSPFEQWFDLDGRYIALLHRDGRRVDISYEQGRPLRVTDNAGRSLEFLYTSAGKISLAQRRVEGGGEGWLMSEYRYDASDNLVWNRNAWAKKTDEVYRFEYNESHNLTRITWPDRSFIRVAYDNERDWVTSFRDRGACIEDYSYVAFDKLHYASFVTKQCGGQVVAENHHEFWHRPNSQGGYSLDRLVQRVSGEEREIWYHDRLGVPRRIRVDDRVIDYRWLDDGRIASRTMGRQRWDYVVGVGGIAGVVEHKLDARGHSTSQRSLAADPWPSLYNPPPAKRNVAGRRAPRAKPVVQAVDGLLAFYAAWHSLRADERFDDALAVLNKHRERLRTAGSPVAELAQLPRMAQVLADDLANTDGPRRKALAVELSRWVLAQGRELAAVDVARAAISAAKLLRDRDEPDAAVEMLDSALAILAQRAAGEAAGADTSQREADIRALLLLQSDIWLARDLPARALAALRLAGGGLETATRDMAAPRDRTERVAEIFDAAGLAAAALRQYRASDAVLWLVLDPFGRWADSESGARSHGRLLARLEGLMADLGRYDDALFINDLRLQRLQTRAPAAAGAGAPSAGASPAATPSRAAAPVLTQRVLWLTLAGRYTQALAAAGEAMAAAGDDAEAKAAALGARATLASRLGDFAEAVDSQQHAAALLAGQAGKAPDMGNLADDLGQLGRYDEAETAFAKALSDDLARLPADHPSVANTRTLWAAMLLRRGDAGRAASLLDQALPPFAEAFGAGHWRTARALGLRAQAALRQGDNAGALAWARRAVESAQQTGQPEWQATADHAMAGALAANAQPVLAAFFAKRAVGSLQGLRASEATLPAAWQQSFVRSRRAVYETAASLLIDAGRLAEAQQVLAMFKESELQDFARRDGDADPRTTRSELGGIEARWQAELAEAAGNLGQLGRELAELDALRRLGPLGAVQAARRAELRAGVDAAQQRFTAALDRIVLEARAQSKDAESAAEAAAKRAPRELRELLAKVGRQSGSRTVALQYLMTDRKLHILVTSPELQFAREVAVGSAALNQAVQALRGVLQRPSRDPLPAAQALWRHLMAPVAEDLQRLGAQTLMVSLTGALRYVPLAALHDGQSYLVQQYRLALMTEAALTLGMSAPSAAWTVGGLGVSARVHPQFTPLPAVREELLRIVRDERAAAVSAPPGAARGVLPGQSYLDAAFTAARLREVLDDQPQVVHLASHFKFSPGSDLASFLLLGDGQQLSLREMFTDAYRFRGVELLTLSACETALGGGVDEAGREVEGLAAQAQKQGAPAVLATLWSVADASTGQLMQRFYALRQSGVAVTKAQALQQAQLELLRGSTPAAAPAALAATARGAQALQPGRDGAGEAAFQPPPGAPFAHPFYWAPFVLIGNWL
jgi:CHAT domain-containing protein